MDKKLTVQQIRDIAKANGIEYAALRVVIEVEAAGDGFLPDGKPKILFEPHVFYKRMTDKRYITLRNRAITENPSICYPKWGKRPCGKVSEQHARLATASTYERDTALESASWGMGQVMGYHWSALGYETLQSFINAMYRNEASQLDAMIRFIRVNGLLDDLKRKDWAGFARGYNGSGYAKNQYDKKLAIAYRNCR